MTYLDRLDPKKDRVMIYFLEYAKVFHQKYPSTNKYILLGIASIFFGALITIFAMMIGFAATFSNSSERIIFLFPTLLPVFFFPFGLIVYALLIIIIFHVILKSSKKSSLIKTAIKTLSFALVGGFILLVFVWFGLFSRFPILSFLIYLIITVPFLAFINKMLKYLFEAYSGGLHPTSVDSTSTEIESQTKEIYKIK